MASPGGIGCWRIESRSNLGGSLAAHLFGDKRPETAYKPLYGGPAITHLSPAEEVVNRRRAQAIHDEAFDRLREKRKERTQKKQRGRRSTGVDEIIMIGPKKVCTYEEALAWAKDAVRFNRECLGPKSRIAIATLHRDERAPHLHLLVVSIGANGRLGFRNVRDNFAGRKTYHPKQCYSLIQDRFQEAVSAKHDIVRGQRRTGRRHEEIDRMKAIPELERQLEERADQRVRDAEIAANQRALKAEEDAAAHVQAEEERLDELRTRVAACAQQVVADRAELDERERNVETSEKAAQEKKAAADRRASEIDAKARQSEAAAAKRQRELNALTEKVRAGILEHNDRHYALEARAKALGEGEEQLGVAREKFRAARNDFAEEVHRYGDLRLVNSKLRYEIAVRDHQAQHGQPVVGPPKTKSAQQIEMENQHDDFNADYARASGKKLKPRRNPEAAPPVTDVDKFVKERVADIDAEIEKMKPALPAPDRPPGPGRPGAGASRSRGQTR